MSGDGARMVAVKVRRGDWVSVRGRWLEVKAVRDERYASSGPSVVLVFKEGRPLRMHATETVLVDRGGQERRRTQRKSSR